MPIYALGARVPECAADTWIADNATLIGSVRLDPGVSVFYGAVLRADNDLIHVGEGTNIQDQAMLHTDAGIVLTIGKHVTVGHHATLHGCIIGDGSLVGIGAIILNRAVIGSHCLVAAGAVVPEGKTYPDRSLILGAPAKVVRPLGEEEVQGLLRGAQQYVERSKLYRSQLRRSA